MTQGGQAKLGPGPEERGEGAKKHGGHPVMEGRQKKEARIFLFFFLNEESRDVWLGSEIMTEGNQEHSHAVACQVTSANASFRQSHQTSKILTLNS